MRKITKEAVNAFEAGQNWQKDNTKVTCENGQVEMYLFGNLIAQKYKGILTVSDGNHPMSNTTKERLNGLPGVSIYTKNHVTYLNGKEWAGNWTEIK